MRLGRSATIAVTIVSVGLVTMLITLVIAAGRRPSEPAKQGIVLPSPPELGLPEPQLLLPNENDRLLSHRFRPFREPRGAWAQEDVDPFWYDPEVVSRSYLLNRGKDRVESILREVP